MSDKPMERAKGSLNIPKTDESWSGELRIGGFNVVQRKDGGTFESWWALIRLTTPFNGVDESRSVAQSFEPNDLVFTNIRGMHAIREFEKILNIHGNPYKAQRWRIPNEEQVVITYTRRRSKKSDRSYYQLKKER